MLLMIAASDDALAEAVVAEADRRKVDCVWLTDEMLESCKFALYVDDHSGYISYNEAQVDFSNLELVVARPSRNWRLPGFSPRDCYFVYHEHIAAWFYLISALPCKVANRYQLTWWIGDPDASKDLTLRTSEYFDLHRSRRSSSPSDRAIYITRKRMVFDAQDWTRQELDALSEISERAHGLMLELDMELLGISFDQSFRLTRSDPCPPFPNDGLLASMAAEALLDSGL